LYFGIHLELPLPGYGKVVDVPLPQALYFCIHLDLPLAGHGKVVNLPLPKCVEFAFQFLARPQQRVVFGLTGLPVGLRLFRVASAPALGAR